MKESLRSEIIQIREKIDILNESIASIAIEATYLPIKDFPNKDEYPLDFQIFMEEIGALSIKTYGETLLKFRSSFSFDLNKGTITGIEDWHVDKGQNSEVIFLRNVTLNKLDAPEDLLIISSVKDLNTFEVKAKDYIAVVFEENFSTYGFYTGNKPYKFATNASFDMVGGKSSDFISWLKVYLNFVIKRSPSILIHLNKVNN